MTYDINFLIMFLLICMDFYVEIILCSLISYDVRLHGQNCKTPKMMERIFRISDQCFQRGAEWDFFRQSCSKKSRETKMTIGHRRMIRIIENGKKFVAWRKITQNIHQCDIKPNREFNCWKRTKNVISSTSQVESRFLLCGLQFGTGMQCWW